MNLKPIQHHEVQDPSRLHSRCYRFTLPTGETALMEITILPQNTSIFNPILRKPTTTQVIQTLNQASQTTIIH